MSKKDLIKTLFFIIVSCMLLLWVFNNYIKIEEKEKNEQKMNVYLTELLTVINKYEDIALTISTLLSKDKNVINCLKTNQISECYKHLLKAKKSLLVTDVFEDMKFHLHTKDLKSLSRLWTIQNEMDSLVSFRHTLKDVKEKKKSISAIEIGRFSMLMRGISPVLSDEEYLGSIEAIVDFEPIIRYFEEKNVRLYVLMDKKYMHIASKKVFNQERILDKYVVLNEKIKDLSFLNDLNLNNTSYKKVDNYSLVYTPIIDYNKEIVGYFVLKVFF